MITPHWIICERSGRWAAALRTALARQLPQGTAIALLDEVRTPADLNARLQEFPRSLVLVEVTRTNFDAILQWLADATRRGPDVIAVALLDYGFSGRTVLARNANRDNQAEVATALREAGAMDVVLSPRHLQPVLSLGRHFPSKNSRIPARLAADQSIGKWAWNLLPWQDARRPLG